MNDNVHPMSDNVDRVLRGRHVGYASRKREQFRFAGDDREYTIEISQQCARAIVNVVNAVEPIIVAEVGSGGPLSQLRDAILDLGDIASD